MSKEENIKIRFETTYLEGWYTREDIKSILEFLENRDKYLEKPSFLAGAPDDSFRPPKNTLEAVEVPTHQSLEPSFTNCIDYPECFCTTSCQSQRLKAISQNGNVGYWDVYDRVERDYADKD